MSHGGKKEQRRVLREVISSPRPAYQLSTFECSVFKLLALKDLILSLEDGDEGLGGVLCVARHRDVSVASTWLTARRTTVCFGQRRS